MANREFKVSVWKLDQPGKLTLRISAKDAPAAQEAAEASGWTVDGVEEVVGATAAGPVTLETILAEVRDLRATVDSLHRAPIIRHPYWTIFWASVLTAAIWGILSLFVASCLNMGHR